MGKNDAGMDQASSSSHDHANLDRGHCCRTAGYFPGWQVQPSLALHLDGDRNIDNWMGAPLRSGRANRCEVLLAKAFLNVFR